MTNSHHLTAICYSSGRPKPIEGITESQEAACAAEASSKLCSQKNTPSKDWSSIFPDKTYWGVGDARTDPTVMVLERETWELNKLNVRAKC